MARAESGSAVSAESKTPTSWLRKAAHRAGEWPGSWRARHFPVRLRQPNHILVSPFPFLAPEPGAGLAVEPGVTFPARRETPWPRSHAALTAWRDFLLFHEFFHGDNGTGLGASHQTGWTALAATMLEELAG